MKFAEFVTLVTESLQRSFVTENNNEIMLLLQKAAPSGIPNVNVLRVQRSDFPTNMKSFWKTFLIVELNDKTDLKFALEWAASARDLLSNPETSDLYLFMCWENEAPSSDECLRIEATEEFCRKYVLRSGEKGKEFIQRTLIEDIEDVLPKGIGADPLLTAFSEVESKHVWFKKDQQQQWKEAFASGKSGRELIEELFLNTK